MDSQHFQAVPSGVVVQKMDNPAGAAGATLVVLEPIIGMDEQEAEGPMLLV